MSATLIDDTRAVSKLSIAPAFPSLFNFDFRLRTGVSSQGAVKHSKQTYGAQRRAAQQRKKSRGK